MKHIQIRIIGSKYPPVKLQIQEGTRSCDVLPHLKLTLNWLSDSWVLARASDPTTYFRLHNGAFATPVCREEMMRIKKYRPDD